MANLLKQLELEELSLVDRPANAQAMVSLYKRDNPEGTEMTDTVTKMTDGQKEEMDKMSADMKTKMNGYMKGGMSYDQAKAMCMGDAKKSLEDEVTKLKAENEKLRKGLLDEGYTIEADKITKAAPAEFVEYGGEQINKADIPAPILKALEAAEFEKADNALTKRAEETLPHFDIAVAKGLLSAVEKMSDSEKLMAALVAADKAFEAAMTEVGKSDNSGEFTTAKDKLDAMAKAYQTEKGVSYAVAYAEVAKTAEGKALINKSYKDKE